MKFKEATQIITELDVLDVEYHTKQRFKEIEGKENKIHYSNQKEHFLAYLADKADEDFLGCIKSKLRCGTMVCWLAESLGIDVTDAVEQVKSMPVEPNSHPITVMNNEKKEFLKYITINKIEEKMKSVVIKKSNRF